MTYFLETRSRCSTKMWRISVTDGDIGKIPNCISDLSDAWKFLCYISCGYCNNSAIVNPKYKTANINAKTSSKFKAKL